jgi:guanylate kinase
MKSVVQVQPWRRFPSGDAKSVAILPLSPDEIERRYGIRFESGRDDLDSFKLAAIGEREIGQFWLMRYDNAPSGETEVLTDSALPRLDGLAALHRCLGGVTPSSVVGEDQWQVGPPRPVVLILHGPSGVGKESVIEGLQRATNIRRATSTTDRAPRDGELDGVDYHFVTTGEFERRIREGAFAEYARVYGDWKGLERREVESHIERGEDVIIRTDVQGARTWRSLLSGTVAVLIVAAEPALAAKQHRAVTEARIRHRDPEIDATTLAMRLQEVDDELGAVEENDYIVINGDDRLDDAVAQLLAIIDSERTNPRRPDPRWTMAELAGPT